MKNSTRMTSRNRDAFGKHTLALGKDTNDCLSSHTEEKNELNTNEVKKVIQSLYFFAAALRAQMNLELQRGK